MEAPARKRDLALFAENIELCDITENLVFSDPYFDAELNHHTSPQLDDIVARMRRDIDLKVAAQEMKAKFSNNAETLLHGDLHTGSIMVTGAETRVIDPEFAVYGPIGFDIGMLLANFLMAYYAQPGHAASAGARQDYQEWILGVVAEIWRVFQSEFSQLWRSERNGILFQKSLFEDQGDALGAEQALGRRLNAIWQDTLGFAGAEIIRRTLSLAHIAEYDQIESDDMRAACERKGLLLGRQILVNREGIANMQAALDLARIIERGEMG